MKAYVILRGFPGLGRVVGGLALVEQLKNYAWEFKIATYGRGLAAIKERGFCETQVSDVERNDGISSIGIIPVSRFGEAILSEIDKWKPDLIICDGEPLLLEAMAIIGLKNKVVALVNQFDLFNPRNQYSSQKYFSHLYNQSGMILLHGLEINESMQTDKCKIMNTIIRPEVIELGNANANNNSCKAGKIVGIIGGGIYKANRDFKVSSIRIAEIFVQLARLNKGREFVLYFNDFEHECPYELDKNIPDNISIIDRYASPNEMYSNAELVIARAGRNTISELIFLKKKAMVIPTTKHDFRSGEQEYNIFNAEKITNGNIIGLKLNCDTEEMNLILKKQLEKQAYKYTWNPGNDKAVNEILNFKKKNM